MSHKKEEEKLRLSSDIIVLDNTRYSSLGEFFEFSDDAEALIPTLVNNNLKQLEEKYNKNFFVVPESFTKAYGFSSYDDPNNVPYVLERHGFSEKSATYYTHNIMGFVGKNREHLIINSRFSAKDHINADNDFFLDYMLAKVLRINYVDMKVAFQRGNLPDMAMFLFPHALHAAMTQGIYRQYVRRDYNDSRIRGPIDVHRFIRQDIPFQGKIAYHTRERDIDNPVTQLVRHTCEFIKYQGASGCKLLNTDTDTHHDVIQIQTITDAHYAPGNRQSILEYNTRHLIAHPYYTAWRTLQELCIRILHNEKISFAEQNTDELYGILFDGAWLWEEYLNTVFHNLFFHPENKENKGGHYLFSYSDNSGKDIKEQHIYPDFISRKVRPSDNQAQQPVAIADAKYKREDNIGRNDYFQVLAYMMRFDSTRGLYLHPGKEDDNSSQSSPDNIGLSRTYLHLLTGVNFSKSNRHSTGEHRRTETGVAPENEPVLLKLGFDVRMHDGDDYTSYTQRMKAQEKEARKIVTDYCNPSIKADE